MEQFVLFNWATIKPKIKIDKDIFSLLFARPPVDVIVPAFILSLFQGKMFVGSRVKQWGAFT